MERSGQWLYANPAAARLLNQNGSEKLLRLSAAAGSALIEEFKQKRHGEVVAFGLGASDFVDTDSAPVRVLWLRSGEGARDEGQQALAEGLLQSQTRLQLYKSISQRINAGMGVDAVIAHTLRAAHKNFPRLRISFGSLDAQDGFRISESVGPSHMPNITGFEGRWQGAEFLEEGLLLGQVIVIPDVQAESRLAPLWPILDTMKTQAWVLVTVRQTRGAGFLSFEADERRQWSEHEVATLVDMAEFLTLGLREADRESLRQKMEEHLREAQKREAISRLVGGLAHDFNNLLTAMMIYAGLLGSSLGREHALHRHVDEIRRAGERGAELVEQMLALSRQQVLEPRVVDLRRTLQDMGEMMTRVLGEDIVLEIAPGEEARVKVDPGQIQQVVLNLALNARDAMPRGGRVRIATEAVSVDEEAARRDPELLEGDYIALIVSDDGTGMDATTRQNLFEPFFTTKGHGHGLGLATALGIVKQHKGAIQVESAPGEGTTFRILLPRAAEMEESLREATPQALTSAPRILLVEDEEAVRRSMVEMLAEDGYQVQTAANGREALAAMGSALQPLDLVITDLVMPHMSGRELSERVQELDPGVPVMFISGYTDDPRTRELMSTAAYFCRKPFTPEGFLRKVRQILHDHPRRAQGAVQGGENVGLET
ncbi:MAG: response regulator [Acidobacteriales bacterium]|nr:response regulator [Terriglobales bacterium]